jgi:hypothetical protein
LSGTDSFYSQKRINEYVKKVFVRGKHLSVRLTKYDSGDFSLVVIDSQTSKRIQVGSKVRI